VYVGHDAANIQDADLVVYSSAISAENPEIIEAKRRNIPVIQRAAMLATLMQDKKVITVTGAHGKTTTTSLIAHLLLEAGLSPTVAIGGILRNLDSNAYLGRSDFFVAEADESDGSFLCYRPDYSIITNIDFEHLDYYKSFDNLLLNFGKFLDNTKENGCVWCCGDDAHLKKLLANYKKRSILFGLSQNADIHPANITLEGLSSSFDCFYNNKAVGRFSLSLGGEHNIVNALSVIGLGLELGITLENIKKALSTFKGAKRRLEIKLDSDKVRIMDDYAHHPTEIKATLFALRSLKRRRTIAVFQPHRYSRTKLLFPEFGKSFDLVDSIIITDIYPAGEKPIENVSASLIVDAIREHGHRDVRYLPKEGIVAELLKTAQPGDLIITLGAGDITKISDELAERFIRENKI
jgi:UDP-N-acetylmuramate--alanine ligase